MKIDGVLRIVHSVPTFAVLCIVAVPLVYFACLDTCSLQLQPRLGPLFQRWRWLYLFLLQQSHSHGVVLSP
jgi:hypothetical protein